MVSSAVNSPQTNNSVVSGTGNWQQFQSWYSQITGKKESIRKSFSDPFQMSFSDLEDIHHRICQTAQSYNVVGNSVNISVAYNDKASLQHSSFEKFSTQASSGNTAIKSVVMTYNFAFKASESDHVGQYKITLDLSSALAIFKELKEELPRIFWPRFRYRSIEANIEHVDFSIAHNFMAVITAWAQSRKVAPERKILDLLQSKSHFIPIVTRFTVLVLCAYFFSLSVASKVDQTNDQLLAKYLIIVATSTWIFAEIGRLLGKAIEDSVDQIWKITYLKLNEGDEKLVENVQAHNKTCWISVAAKVIGFLMLAVATSCIDKLVSKFF